MHLRIINPNTTRRFTDRNLALGRAVAASGTIVSSVQPEMGSPAVECHADEALAAVGVAEEVRLGERDGVDAYVIACFGDAGIQAAREIARGPVVGMTEAALFAAALIADRFAIVTLPRRTRIQAERVVRLTGLGHRCLPVRAIDVDVLDSDDDGPAVRDAVIAEARRAIAQDGAEAVILGCAGLSALVAPLAEALGVPVIDGVAAAVKMAEGLAALGLGTSKAGGFAYPPARPGA